MHRKFSILELFEATGLYVLFVRSLFAIVYEHKCILVGAFVQLVINASRFICSDIKH